MNQTYSSSLTKTSSSFLAMFLAQVYGFMTAGLFITFGIALGLYILFTNNPALSSVAALALPFVLILELVIVIALSFFGQRLSGLLAGVLFILYSVLNGVFFGVFISAYEISSVFIAILATTVTFAVLTVFGLVVKRDLGFFGTIALFGLVGLLVGTFINIIVALINPSLGNGLYWILTYVGIAIFSVLIAVDSQRIKKMGLAAESAGGSIINYSIQGALTLYLDFVNMFIRVMAILGKRR